MIFRVPNISRSQPHRSQEKREKVGELSASSSSSPDESREIAATENPTQPKPPKISFPTLALVIFTPPSYSLKSREPLLPSTRPTPPNLTPPCSPLFPLLPRRFHASHRLSLSTATRARDGIDPFHEEGFEPLDELESEVIFVAAPGARSGRRGMRGGLTSG